jgi:uncharacterized protein (TIGR02186 family)
MTALAKWAGFAAVLGVAGALTVLPASAVEPGIIEADAAENNFYIRPDFTGSTVVIFGAVRRSRVLGNNFDIAVSVRGPVNGVTVWKKRRAGPVWINREKLEFDTAPSFYAALGTADIGSMAPFEERAAYELGLDTLRLQSAPADLHEEAQSDFRHALIEAKRAAGLYLESDTGVERSGESLFRARFFLPPAAGPGLYRVKVLLIQDGKIKGTSLSHVRIEKTGVERLLSNASATQPWAYGVIAVLIAVAVGGAASLLPRRDG